MIKIREGAQEFVLDEHEELLDRVDSYVLGCALAGLDMNYFVDKFEEGYRVVVEDEKAAGLELVDRTKGFEMLISCDCLEVHTSIKGLVNFNARSLAGSMRSKKLKWVRKKRGIYHRYRIKLNEEREIEKFLEVMRPYLP
jgi:hypothetical protein